MSLIHSIVSSIIDRLSEKDSQPVKPDNKQSLQDDHAWPLIWSENVKRYN